MSEETELAEVCSSHGRYYLTVAGVVMAMEGGKCRDVRVVQFFRGISWNKKMLDYVAKRINEAAGHCEDVEHERRDCGS
jgi:hypothetical protein